MSFNVTYSFNNGAVTGSVTSITALRQAIYNYAHSGNISSSTGNSYSNLTQCTLSGTVEGQLTTNNVQGTSTGTNYGLFEGCSYLVSIDLSNLNTSNVTNMSYMFFGCTKLEYIKVSNLFNTTKVVSSGSMFSSCSKLPNYDSAYTDKTNAYIGGYFVADPEIGDDFVYQQHIKRDNQLCKIYPRISPDFKMIRIVTNAEYNALGSSVETDNVLYIIRD